MTNLSNHIQDVITAVKALPNSYEKNKINSHLQDALVWAKELDRKFDSAPHPAETEQAECTCPAGARDFACGVHGN